MCSIYQFIKRIQKYWIILLLFIIVSETNGFSQPSNSYLKFDGVDDYVSLGNSSALKPTDSITIEGWVYLNDWSMASNYVFFGNTQAGGCNIRTSSTHISTSYRINGSYLNVSFSKTLMESGWHHVASTFDGQFVKLYLDGVLKSTGDAGGVYPVQYDDNNCTFLGAEVNGDCSTEGLFFKGYMDEIRYWNIVRTGEEIANDKNSEINSLTPGLIGYWRLNDKTGTQAADELNLNNGILYNFPPDPWVFLPYTFPETGLSFDGVDDYVIVPHSSIGNPSDDGDFTVEAHVKMLGWPSSTGDIISKHKSDGTPKSGYAIEYNNNNRLSAALGTASGWQNITGQSWNLDEWHHVAITYQAASDQFCLYDNGLLQGAITVPDPDFNTNDLCIGSSQHYNTNLFEGIIDEIRIWDIALDSAQIRNQLFISFDSLPENLRAYWLCNEATGSNIYDETGNHTGSLINKEPA
ncbi:MAG: LamG domain-containing protein [Bacteroidales bacterium]